MIAAGQAILFGSTVVIRKKFSASSFWNDIARHNCTVRWLFLQIRSDISGFCLKARISKNKIESKDFLHSKWFLCYCPNFLAEKKDFWRVKKWKRAWKFVNNLHFTGWIPISSTVFFIIHGSVSSKIENKKVECWQAVSCCLRWHIFDYGIEASKKFQISYCCLCAL